MNALRPYLYLSFVVTLVVSGVLSFLSGQERQAVSERWLYHSQLVINRQVSALEDELNHVTRDLRFIADLFDYQSDAEALAVNKLTHLLRSFSNQQGSYGQIRYLDMQGQERIRINLNREQAEFVPSSSLQNKKHRYYFKDSIKLPHGSIYISPFDLNIENRKIEVPLKPVIRFATPVLDSSGRKSGVVVINYLGGQMIERIVLLDHELSSKTILINGQGYYLTAFEADKAWGFMFPERETEQFYKEYPRVWKQINKSGSGQKVTLDGDIYTYGKVRLSLSEQSTGCDNCSLYVVNRLGHEQIEQLANDNLGFTPQRLVLIYLAVLLFAMLVLWYIRQHNRAHKELDALHLDISRERDLFADGPAVLFRWRNEFGWPVEQVSKNLREVLGYREEQFLNGELGFASIVAPEDLQRITQELTQALQDNRDKFYRSPYRIIESSGKTRWVRDTIRVIRNQSGEAVELYAYLMDIDAVKQAEAELEASQAYIQHLLDTIPDPTLVIDVDSYEVVSANHAASETYLKKDQKIDGLTCYQISHKTDKPCSGSDEPCPIAAVLSCKKACSVVHKHYDAEGLPFYVEVLASPMLDEAGDVVRILESHRDITQYIENQESLQQKAFTDSLTGINNRAGFEKSIKREMEKAQASGGHLGLVMFDLDHFKHVNDTYGHQVGDQVLIDIARIVQQHIRSYDIFARWGGEEFMLLLPRTDLDAVAHVAETLRHTVAQHQFGEVDRVTISLGATCWQDEDSVESFVERADNALYESKHNGRNRVTVSDGKLP